MFSPAFRQALERTLHDDITPESLEAVFRSSMRKITEAKKCRTGVNLGKNLLIAKIMHKTRNIIIAAKKEQEMVAAASITGPTPPVSATAPAPASPKAPALLPAPVVRARPPSLSLEAPAGDENVAPTPLGASACLPTSPRPLKRSSTWCGADSSAFWTTPVSPPASKVARMEVDESRDDQPASACHNCRSSVTPSVSPSSTAIISSPAPSPAQGHLHHFHQQQNHLQSPPPSPPPALWTFCAKEQPNPSPVLPTLYSPYPQRMSLPLTTCPI